MQTNLFAQEENKYPIERLPHDPSLIDFGSIYEPAKAKEIFESLLREVPWQHDTAFIYGRHIVTKRQVAWFADQDFDYNYSNTTRPSIPWTPLLRAIQAKVKDVCGYDYNSVLLNLYSNGSEGMGWHSDDEKGLGSSPNIASLSFGATRRFDIRHKQTGETIKIPLDSSRLIVMKDKSQSHWKHQVPKQLRVKEPRINLTFRTYLD